MFSTILAWIFFVIGSISVFFFIVGLFNGTVDKAIGGELKWNPIGLVALMGWVISGIYLFG